MEDRWDMRATVNESGILLDTGRKMKSPSRREHAHKLFERLEGLTKLELKIQVIDILEIGGERRKMVRIIPLPRWCLMCRIE